MHVAALYRSPLKGFTHEECGVLPVLDGGRIAGDRVLGVRFNDSTIPDDAWGTKLEFLSLANTPGLARLQLAFNPGTRKLRIERQGQMLVDETLDDIGRKRIAAPSRITSSRQVFPRERPTFAIAMRTDRGGSIHVGDKVELCE